MFICSQGLGAAVSYVEVCHSFPGNPHWPVEMGFVGALQEIRVLRFRKYPQLPRKQVMGPLLPEADWDHAVVVAAKTAASQVFNDLVHVVSELWNHSDLRA